MADIISNNNNYEQAASNALCNMTNRIQSMSMTTEVHLHWWEQWIATNGSGSNWNWWLLPLLSQNGRMNQSGTRIQKQRRRTRKVDRVIKSSEQSAYGILSGRRRDGSIYSQRMQSVYTVLQQIQGFWRGSFFFFFGYAHNNIGKGMEQASYHPTFPNEWFCC